MNNNAILITTYVIFPLLIILPAAFLLFKTSISRSYVLVGGIALAIILGSIASNLLKYRDQEVLNETKIRN